MQRGTGPIRIQRVDRNRTMTITGTASGRPIGDVAKDVQAVMRETELPAGYTVQVRGGVQQLNNSFATLGQALILAIILEYMLLVALYESWFHPVVLILGVPLGIVGSLLALFVTGNTLNIFSIIGLIMAVGLVAKTGILLVDYTNTLRRRGMERTAALAEAARVRLRPILMTTATMCMGMIPLALKLEPGAESRSPMAVVVIGGLLSSTLLATLVTPSLYTLHRRLADAGLPRRRHPAHSARAPRRRRNAGARAATSGRGGRRQRRPHNAASQPGSSACAQPTMRRGATAPTTSVARALLSRLPDTTTQRAGGEEQAKHAVEVARAWQLRWHLRLCAAAANPERHRRGNDRLSRHVARQTQEHGHAMLARLDAAEGVGQRRGVDLVRIAHGDGRRTAEILARVDVEQVVHVHVFRARGVCGRYERRAADGDGHRDVRACQHSSIGR